MPAVLGISAFTYDSAAAIAVDGEIRAAAQQERFSRRKHDNRFPGDAIRFCLDSAGVPLSSLDAVVFYENPELRLARILDTVGRDHPNRDAYLLRILPAWLQQPDVITQRLLGGLQVIDPGFEPTRLGFTEHHRSHAASAFFPAPFERAAVLTIDGVGEFATTAIHRGDGAALETLKTIEFPNSLGLLYAAFTAYLGFKINDSEYRMMGLAAHGQPVYAEKIKDTLIRLHADGSFSLDQSYFDFFTSYRMFNERFTQLFQQVARFPLNPPDQSHMNIAASIQAVITEAVLGLARRATELAGSRQLCLAGGVALNNLANGALVRSGIVDELWIQPAPGDAGGAIGAALIGCFERGARRRAATAPRDGMAGSRLGPAFDQTAIEAYLRSVGATFDVAPSDDAVVAETIGHLAAGCVVGWFQGRMEFGPSALGARSILADPRNPEMQRILSLKTKVRDAYRPFAAAVTREAAAAWFEIESSPYMLVAAPVREAHRLVARDKQRPGGRDTLTGLYRLGELRSTIPVVTHVDYSGRVQTVERETDPLFHRLVGAFGDATGVPILVNANFAINDGPIVCTPDDAYRCFIGAQIDVLVMGRCIVRRDAPRAPLPVHQTVIRTEQYQPESLWCVQWYSPGMTHAFNNRHTDMMLTQLHQGPVTRYETFGDWVEAAARRSYDGTVIVVCGSSQSIGSINWPYYLENELTALGYDSRVVVINLAQGAYSTFDSALLLEAFLARIEPYGLKPQVVVSLDGFNDVLMRVYSYIRQLRDGDADTNPLGVPQENLILERAGIKRESDAVACPELMPLLNVAWTDDVLPKRIRLDPAVEHDIVRRFKATLGELRALCAARGIPCVNVLQPVLLPSSATLIQYVKRLLAQSGVQIPAGAGFDLRNLARPVAAYKLRRSVEDIFCTGIAFQQDVGGPFQIVFEPIFAACWTFWLELGAAAGRADFIDLLQLFSEDPYPAYQIDAIHYTLDGSRRIAAQIAQRLLEHRDVYLTKPTSCSPAAAEGVGLLRHLYAQYGKDVAIRSLDQLRDTTPRAEIDRELQALLVASGHLAEARGFDAEETATGPDDSTIRAMVALCVEAAAQRAAAAARPDGTSWQDPGGRPDGALTQALHAHVAKIRARTSA